MSFPLSFQEYRQLRLIAYNLQGVRLPKQTRAALSSTPGIPAMSDLPWAGMSGMSSIDETERSAEPPVSRAGRYLVVSMFLMGLTATGLLFAYWQFHLMPFMPLQEAIVAEFKDSAPRVEGGRHKMHQDSPSLLRIVMRVPFDPTRSDPEVRALLEHHMTRLKALAAEHLQTDEYQMMEVHFYHPVKEKEIREFLIRRDFQSWKDVDATGQSI